ITLRTVAGESPRSWRRVTVREPTASPPCRYSVTTACRIFCARLDSSLPAMSVPSILHRLHDARRDRIRHQKAAQSRADPVGAALGEPLVDEKPSDRGPQRRLGDAVG